MTSPSDSKATDLRVGELARRTGLTVRALHHYDEIGLLTPSRRSAAGYRLYGGRDVARLLRIRAMQQLGFSLDEIRTVLDDPEGGAPTRVLALRVEALREQVAAAERLRVRLERLQQRLDEDVSVSEFLDAITEMTMFEKYYTPEQLAALQRRRDETSPEELQAVAAEWPRLIEAVRDAQRAGTPVSHPDVQRLAARWAELVNQFTGGDPAIRASLGSMYANEPDVRAEHGLDAELMRYVAEAQRAGEAGD